MLLLPGLLGPGSSNLNVKFPTYLVGEVKASRTGDALILS